MSIPNENLQKLTAFLDSFLFLGVPGYDCAVYYRGEPVYRRMNGYADRENKIAFTGHEHYNIYSATKVFTCVCAMQLWEQGAFKLTDPLWAYLPEFKEMTVRTPDGIKKAEKAITVADLFQMTSGITYCFASPHIEEAKKVTGGRCPTRETVKYIAREPLAFEPGEHWLYGFSHDVLAALIEVLSGERFSVYAKKHLFDPLGMNETTLIAEDEPDYVIPQYLYHNDTCMVERIHKRITHKLGSEYESGGAGGISTVDDYLRLLEALRVGDTVLKKSTIDLMQTDRLNETMHKDFWHGDYGYGLGLRCPRKGYAPTDFGWAGAVGIFLAVDREHEISVFHGQHVLNPPNNGTKHLIMHILNGQSTDQADRLIHEAENKAGLGTLEAR